VADSRATSPPRTLDPMADPGIASAELHSIAPTSMLLRASAAVSMEPEADRDGSQAVGPTGPQPAVEGTQAEVGQASDDGGDRDRVPAAPPRLGIPNVAPPGPAPATGTPDGGAVRRSASAVGGLRLVARRRLWDGGTQVRTVPALAGLHQDPRLLVHPSVLAELGSADGESVTVTSPRGSLVIAARGDKSIPETTALLGWNIPGTRAGDLVDGSDAFTEVTIAAAPQGGESRGS
jgi:hypothetical protein